MIDPPLLRGRDRYVRVMEGRIDDAPDGAVRHTVRIDDGDRGVEVSAVALPSPTYEIREAAARILHGHVAADAVAGVATLPGACMVVGFTRRVADATGTGDGASLVVDAAIEIARLARQVAKMPREHALRAAGGDPWECWQLDTTGWVDLPDSCFTYTAAGRALFGTRPVTTPMQVDLYSPRPGQERLFVRRKTARLERAGDRLALFHAMHDNVHGFEITYEVEVGSGRIVRAESVTPRLPYLGICSEPQAKVGALLGETVDAGLRKRIGSLLGGAAGCAQLYDLTADLLKLCA